jgi:hypothetical protein
MKEPFSRQRRGWMVGFDDFHSMLSCGLDREPGVNMTARPETLIGPPKVRGIARFD